MPHTNLSTPASVELGAERLAGVATDALARYQLRSVVRLTRGASAVLLNVTLAPEEALALLHNRSEAELLELVHDLALLADSARLFAETIQLHRQRRLTGDTPR